MSRCEKVAQALMPVRRERLHVVSIVRESDTAHSQERLRYLSGGPDWRCTKTPVAVHSRAVKVAHSVFQSGAVQN